MLTVRCAAFGFSYRRSGGPGWTFWFPLVLVGMVAVQVTLGFAGVRGLHVFWGVLFLCAATTLCSYLWRLQPVVALRLTRAALSVGGARVLAWLILTSRTYPRSRHRPRPSPTRGPGNATPS